MHHGRAGKFFLSLVSSNRYILRVVAFSACLALLCGCGEDNPLGRKAISGKVTLDGTPLDQGSISFQPVQTPGVAANTAAVNTGAVIEKGQYSIPADQGLLPGTYRVVISSPEQSKIDTTDPNEAMKQAATGAAPPKERIPAEYNVNSNVTIEVKSDGKGTFDFDVKSKG
jgi:hypothetical protein